MLTPVSELRELSTQQQLLQQQGHETTNFSLRLGDALAWVYYRHKSEHFIKTRDRIEGWEPWNFYILLEGFN